MPQRGARKLGTINPEAQSCGAKAGTHALMEVQLLQVLFPGDAIHVLAVAV